MPLKQPRNIKGYTYVCNYDPKRPDSYNDPYYRFLDESGRNNIISPNGDVVNIRDVSVVGNSSISFDGTGDYLSIPDSADWDFGSDNFTIDMWVYTKDITSSRDVLSHIHNFGSTYNGWYWGINTSGKLKFNTNANTEVIVSTNSIPNNTWVHIALVAHNGTLTQYINGIIDGSWTGSVENSSGVLTVGSLQTIQYWYGYIDEIRICKNIDQTENPDDLLFIDTTALLDSTSNILFSPPTTRHQPDYDEYNDRGSVLLIHPEDTLRDYYEVEGGDTWFDETLEYGRVYDDQAERWVPIIDGKGFGYICGGYNGSVNLSSIDRMQFSIEAGTTKHVSNLNKSTRHFSGNNSSTHGYTYGGEGSTTIDKFQFPFDSGNVTRVGVLSNYRYGISANNSSTHGYIIAGRNGATDYSTIDRIEFPHDSGTASNIGSLSGTRYGTSSINSSIAGYTMGGYSASYYTYVNKFIFPFDSGTTSRVGNLAQTTYLTTPINSSVYGYACGAYNGSNELSIISRFIFPFDSGTSTNTGNINSSIKGAAGINSSKAGFICGGNVVSYFSQIRKFAFPFDSGTATSISNLSQLYYASAGIDTTDFNGLFTN